MISVSLDFTLALQGHTLFHSLGFFMSAGLLFLTSLLATNTPTPGEYRLMYEDIKMSYPQWDVECGPKPKPENTPKNSILKVTIEGDSWVAEGAGRRFGPATCEGISKHLKLADHRVEKKVHYLICFSNRVQSGTEEVESKIWLDEKAGHIHIHTTSLHSQRVRRRYQCDSQMRHETVIASRAFLKKKRERAIMLARQRTTKQQQNTEINPFTGKPDKPVVEEKPKEPTTRLEKDFEKELQEKMEEVPFAPITIVHEHQMSKDFIVLSRQYKVDGRLLPQSSKKPGIIKEGTRIPLYEEYMSEGTHTVEVELVYRGFARNAPFKVTLRDVFFIDIDDKTRPQTLSIVAYERGNIFTARRDRPRIKFNLAATKGN